MSRIQPRPGGLEPESPPCAPLLRAVSVATNLAAASQLALPVMNRRSLAS